MKLIEHVYAVKNTISGGPSSQNFSFTESLISHFLQVTRAYLTEQKIDKYHYISEQSYQDWCADLELSTFHNCCTDLEVECLILKSTVPIPKFLNSRWGNHLKVMDLTGRTLPEISLTQNRYAKYSLSGSMVGWFIHDNYLYVVNSTKLEKIILNALFNNPEEVHDLNCPQTTENCTSFMDEEFPIDPDLVQPMYNLTIQHLMRSMQIPRDNENNARDVEAAQGIQ